MALVRIKHFAETRGKRGRLFPDQKMRTVSVAAAAEERHALPAFFRIQRRHGGGERDEVMGKGDGRGVAQMGKQHALRPEMAEKGDRTAVCACGAVEHAVADVSVPCKDAVQPLAKLRIAGADIARLHDGGCKPRVGIVQFGMLRQKGGEHVPAQVRFPFHEDGVVKLPQPRQDDGVRVDLPRRFRARLPRPPEWRTIDGGNVLFAERFRQQRRFAFSLFGQTVVFVIGIGVPYDEDAHNSPR